MQLAIALSGIALDIVFTAVNDQELRTITKPLTFFLIANYALNKKAQDLNIYALVLFVVSDILGTQQLYVLQARTLQKLAFLHYGFALWQRGKSWNILFIMSSLLALLVLIANVMYREINALDLLVYISMALGGWNLQVNLATAMFLFRQLFLMMMGFYMQSYTIFTILNWSAHIIIQYDMSNHDQP